MVRDTQAIERMAGHEPGDQLFGKDLLWTLLMRMLQVDAGKDLIALLVFLVMDAAASVLPNQRQSR